MSEYLTVAVQYKDEELLRQAIENVTAEMGIRAEIHPQDQERHLFGYLGDRRPETAQFLVRRNYLDRLSNDLGWSPQPDGTYRLIVSEYDQTVLRCQRITGAVDVEYQRLYVERQVQTNPRLRGSRVVANRDARTGVVQLQILNVRV